MRLFKVALITLSILWIGNAQAQEKVRTVGFQFKPMLPGGLVNERVQEKFGDSADFFLGQRFGYEAGMVIRWGFTKALSLESGINYVSRKLFAETEVDGILTRPRTDFTVVSYSLPIQGLVYVKLADKMYMNAATGFSLDMFPSDVRSFEDSLVQYSRRISWFQPAFLANIGWEYRTEESGYFYLGVSFKQFFRPIYISETEYLFPTGEVRNELFGLSGNYLTLDLRYFFHEEPQKKKDKYKEQQKDAQKNMPWMQRGK